MRITNISKAIGSGQNIVSHEVRWGNQTALGVKIPGVDVTDASVTFDIEQQLFKGGYTSTRSAATIGSDFAKATASNGKAYKVIQKTTSDLVFDTSYSEDVEGDGIFKGRFNLLVSKDILSQFTSDIDDATVDAPEPIENDSSPFMVLTKIQWKTGTETTAEIESFNLFTIVRYQATTSTSL